MATNRIGFNTDFVLVNSNVGIATTNPTSKLQVVGDARVSGVVTAFDFYNDAEYPNIRPTLDLAFSQTKILDSRITFTRASTATYVNSVGILTTAAVDTARFDHNPATGESLGLLVEEARTNYTTNSMVGFNYNRNGISPVVSNTTETTAPDGTNTARLYVADGTVSTPYVQPGITGSFLTGYTSLSVSVYVKIRAGFTGSSLTYSSDPGLDNSPFVSITWNPLSYVNPTPVTGTGGTSAQVVYVGNGWFRCSASYSGSSITHTGSLQSDMYISGNGSSTTNGFYLWGEQIENGPFVTSYIPTTSATVTRAADVASMTGTNFLSWYNQTEGTMFVADRGTPSTGTGGKSFCIAGAGTSMLTRLGAYSATQSALDSFTSSSQDVNFVTNNTGTLRKHAAGLANNNTSYCLNGVIIGTDASCQISGRNMDSAQIGDNIAASAKLNGTIARLAYYPVRLPDAQLQTLTL
jgi:hypothetical protein